MVNGHTLARKENILASHRYLLRDDHLLSAWSSFPTLFSILTGCADGKISKFAGLVMRVTVLVGKCQVHVAKHPLDCAEVLVSKAIMPFE